MKSKTYYGPCDVDEGKMTSHHSCSDENFMKNHDTDDRYGEFLCGEDSLAKCESQTIVRVSDTCCCPLRKRSHDHRPNGMKLTTDGRLYTERRRSFYSLNNFSCTIKLLYSICIFLCIIVEKCSAESTTCDFKGSGLDLEGKGGIQPVYLSCSSGKVDWHYPRSALRIVLQYPGGSDGNQREFHGCIRASPEFEGARLFVEGHRSLVALFSRDDGKPRDRIRCFTSFRGRAALYLEAEPSSGFKDLQASFEYDLQPLPKGEDYNAMEECRPCSNSELVQLYCSADFAAKGFIISAEDDPRLQQTRLTLSASRVFQQTTPVFSVKASSGKGGGTKNTEGLQSIFSEVDDDVISNEIVDEGHRRLFGHLYMPMDCGARAGEGEFMVLGSVRLGQPVLRCAPRLEDWKKVVASAQDHAHCVLES